MWRFEGSRSVWELVKTTGDEPSGRDGHSMTIWRNKIVIFAGKYFIFGGKSSFYSGFDSEIECYSNETHFFDIPTSTWTRVITNGIAARWRDFHTAAEVGDKLYVFGGRADIFGQLQSNQDYYCNKYVTSVIKLIINFVFRLKYLDLVTLNWHEVQNTLVENTEVQPPGRRSHACFVYKNKMYASSSILFIIQSFRFIFGGYNAREQKHYNDMWCYDTESGKWAELMGYGKRPSARRRHTAVCIGSKVITIPNEYFCKRSITSGLHIWWNFSGS